MSRGRGAAGSFSHDIHSRCDSTKEKYVAVDNKNDHLIRKIVLKEKPQWTRVGWWMWRCILPYLRLKKSKGNFAEDTKLGE